MCEPVSIGLGLATFGLGAAQSITQATMGAQTARVNAAALEQQAQIRLQKGEFDADQAINKYERLAGQARANIGVTGISADSFGDVLADSAMESALEVKAIRWGAAHEAKNLQFQASVQRANAKAAKVGGIFGVLGSALKGFSAFKGMQPGGTQGFSVPSWNATVTPVAPMQPLGVSY
jgi:hypothetical protein